MGLARARRKPSALCGGNAGGQPTGSGRSHIHHVVVLVGGGGSSVGEMSMVLRSSSGVQYLQESLHTAH